MSNSNYNPREHHRKSIRLKYHDYSSPGVYFITMITLNRKKLFGYIENGIMHRSTEGNILHTYWSGLEACYPDIKLDEFVVMPDHFHAIVIIKKSLTQHLCSNQIAIPGDLNSRRKMLIPKLVGRFKMQTTKAINLCKGEEGSKIWQRDYYERLVRNREILEKVRRYIKNNPKNWGKKKRNRTKPVPSIDVVPARIELASKV